MTAMWDSPMFVEAAAFKTDYWTPGERVLLYKGVPAVLKATAQLIQEPRRWNDDPKQALTCTITGDLVQWFLDVETWLAPQLKGDFRSVVKPNLFGEQFVRAKLFEEARLFDTEGTHSTNTPAAGFLHRLN